MNTSIGWTFTIVAALLLSCSSKNGSLTAPGPAETEPPAPPPVVVPPSPFADIEREILAGINVYRGQGNQLNPVFNRAGVSVGVRSGRYVGVVVFSQKAGL